MKYRGHPSVLAIGEVYNKNQRLPFCFSKARKYETLRGILKFKTTKMCQHTGIHKKIAKENADIFADVLVSNFNDCIKKIQCSSHIKKCECNTCI